MAYTRTHYQDTIMSEHTNKPVEKLTNGNRRHLDMRQNQPIWNLAMHSNKRFENEAITGYLYKPRQCGTKLPSLHRNKLSVMETRAGRSYPKSRSPDLHAKYRADENLPPLKFHASVDSYPFSRKTCSMPKWAFQDKDASSPRFQNETFRIFRPMLYSVLLTSKILPQIRKTPSRSTNSQNSDHSNGPKSDGNHANGLINSNNCNGSTSDIST